MITKRCRIPKELRNDLKNQFEKGKVAGWYLFPKSDTDTKIEYVRHVPSKQRGCAVGEMQPLYNILYTVSTQQHQYNVIMYAIGYTVATCFDRKLSSSGH